MLEQPKSGQTRNRDESVGKKTPTGQNQFKFGRPATPEMKPSKSPSARSFKNVRTSQLNFQEISTVSNRQPSPLQGGKKPLSSPMSRPVRKVQTSVSDMRQGTQKTFQKAQPIFECSERDYISLNKENIFKGNIGARLRDKDKERLEELEKIKKGNKGRFRDVTPRYLDLKKEPQREEEPVHQRKISRSQKTRRAPQQQYHSSNSEKAREEERERERSHRDRENREYPPKQEPVCSQIEDTELSASVPGFESARGGPAASKQRVGSRQRQAKPTREKTPKHKESYVGEKDLCSRLREVSLGGLKSQEQCGPVGRMESEPSPPQSTGYSRPERLKDKEMMQKLLERAVQPRHKKKPVELPEKCSFQPMLSKQSLAILDRVGYDKERLYQSKTPVKEEDREGGPQPRLCEKSVHIDQHRHRPDLPRHELLSRMGEEYSHRKKKNIREKERIEKEELENFKFMPNAQEETGQRSHRTSRLQKEREKSLLAHSRDFSHCSVVDRNQKWAQRREEKLSRLKQEQEANQSQICSFRPHINQATSAVGEKEGSEQFYSSLFVQDGIKSYFTRLEQARALKKEKEARLGKI